MLTYCSAKEILIRPIECSSAVLFIFGGLGTERCLGAQFCAFVQYGNVVSKHVQFVPAFLRGQIKQYSLLAKCIQDTAGRRIGYAKDFDYIIPLNIWPP